MSIRSNWYWTKWVLSISTKWVLDLLGLDQMSLDEIGLDQMGIGRNGLRPNGNLQNFHIVFREQIATSYQIFTSGSSNKN